MKKSIFIRWLASIAVCALALPVFGSSKNPVERPFKLVGYVSCVVQLDGSFAFDNSSGASVGISSHSGLFTAAASGNAFTGVWTLTATAANGDETFGVSVPGDQPGFLITGGTGRYENVTGWFTYVVSDLTLVPNPDGSATMILSYSYVGEGTITY